MLFRRLPIRRWSQGVLFTQDSFDVKNQVDGHRTRAGPGTRISPYFGYQRNGDTGQRRDELRAES